MGTPKAWLSVGNETLLGRTVRVVGEVVTPVVVVAAAGQELPPLPENVRVVRDEVAEHGPLAGLASGLAALEGIADAAYLSACDLPQLSSEFVRVMVAAFVPKLLACVPEIDGRVHPLAGVYSLTILEQVRSRVSAGKLRMIDLLDALPARRIQSSELGDAERMLRSLHNVNTPDDFARLEADR